MAPLIHLPSNLSDTTSSSSFTTSISTNSLSSKHTNHNHNHNTNNSQQQQTLTHRPTLTNLTRWVSRKISRQRLPNQSTSRDGDPNEGLSDAEREERRATEDDYAAWCWAFSEGRSTGDHYSHSHAHSRGIGNGNRGEYEYGYGSHREAGHGQGQGYGHEQGYDENLFSDFDGQSPRNDYLTGPRSAKYEHTSIDHGGEGDTTNTRGTYTFLQTQEDRLGRHESSESVPADQLLRFTPIGHYGYSPLTAGSPVSPPPRILTPARYAETNRMQREKSQELKQKQKAQRGFWGPVRALWLSLRRSR
ncbi:hypothetical protein AFCA_002802 [Aspergillus flavus]|uniref:Uncharacterized protein n=1 Tax=Aspergillus flavus TaxID=5059 RepID=A0AB74CAQ1_ASPFL|nr:hypothetical protein COH20_011655 [Aspergillus flavus]RAQ69615.1 hypothetical protein COH21_000989 [Aspergillus flavus]RMZ43753.1 hypothetical protein CA14_009015 [Aspergillus flavus]UDD55162.1 hypothetical protein AFCA_002802 [Aspergillus flavus]